MDVFQFAKRILEQSDKGMIVMDHHGMVQYATPLFFSATGLDGKAAEGKHLDSLCILKKDVSTVSEVLNTLETAGSWQGNLVFALPGNREKPCHAEVRRIRPDKDQPFIYLVSVASPSSRGARAWSGTIDPVTGLPKVEIFLDRVNQAIRFCSKDKSFPIMFLIRLDRFDLVTDGLGREHGDKILKETGIRLQNAFRESDTIARIDRKTFGLLIKVAKESHASLVAEKVLQSITEPVAAGGHKVVMSASIGIASCHDAGKQADMIMASAETAMHHAGKLGGNVYHFFAKDLNEKARKRIEMENSLRAAIRSEAFVLYYQPKVNVNSRQIVGAEALIRWRHPEKGMVMPLTFIPVAEETGLIIDIGRWVVGEACRQVAEWRLRGLDIVPVAVNVSPRQFQYPGFYDDVKAALDYSGLDPAFLELEITESMLMRDVDQVVGKLRKLSGVGLKLAIDDFGTGYSNLSYLVRFPVSTLKIDRTFVKDLETDDSMAGLTHSIISMSRNLNLKIVAEGAENEQHIAFLKEHGCNVAQGYYYSRPVPAEAFAALLETGKIDI